MRKRGFLFYDGLHQIMTIFMKTIIQIAQSPRNMNSDFNLMVETSDVYAISHHILIAKLEFLYLEISYQFRFIDILKAYSLFIDGIFYDGTKSKIVELSLFDPKQSYMTIRQASTIEIFNDLYNTILNDFDDPNPEITRHLYKIKTTHPDLYELFISLINKALVKQPYDDKWLNQLHLPIVEPFQIDQDEMRRFIELPNK